MTDDDRISVLEHLNRIMDIRFEAADKAIVLYREEMTRRLAPLNELREDVEKDRALLIRGDVYYPTIQALEEWCKELDKKLTIIETRSLTWTAAVGVIFVLVQLAVHFWNLAK